MKKVFLSLLVMLAATTTACMAQSKTKAPKDAPVFMSFTYTGQDAKGGTPNLKGNEFASPLLQGCYPDPSICRKGDDYYIVCSSFAMFPGVPIFHSKDLKNWEQIGHVLDRVSQLEVHNCGISAGVYAPQIIYNKNNDTFYMITTEFSGGFGNIVVKTKDPMKGWSDPYKLNFDGIDPSLFFDEDGKAYVVHNDAPDNGTAQYPGHRVIKVWEYDVEKDQVVAGSSKIVVSGGVNIDKKPDWIEAPHIYKHKGWYYLMCAEGGTGANHSEVIFRSKSVWGPYEAAPSNPILSQRHLPANRPNKIDWAGHADLVDTPDGQYYGVFLAIRPNEKGQVATGRETFILPVDWSGTWPSFQNGTMPMDLKPQNWTFNDSFSKFPLDYRWIAMRGPREEFISQAKNGGLVITPSQNRITDLAPISALFHRQQHINYTAETTLKFTPNTPTAEAGLCLYQSEKYNYTFVIAKKDKENVIRLVKTSAKRGSANTGDVNANKANTEILAEAPVNTKLQIVLRVVCKGDKLNFFYAEQKVNVQGKVMTLDLPALDFQQLGGDFSADILTTDVAGGFTGNLIGLYATK